MAVNEDEWASIVHFDRHQRRRLSLAVALYSAVFTGVLCIVKDLKTKDVPQFTTKIQQDKCSIRSFNFKMVNNVYQLKHIQLTKHMQYAYTIYTTCTIQHSGFS